MDVSVDGSLLVVVELEEGTKSLTGLVVHELFVVAGLLVEVLVRASACGSPDLAGCVGADVGRLHWLGVGDLSHALIVHGCSTAV